jgi:death on curing protein
MLPSRQSSRKTTSSSPSSPSRVRLGDVLFPTVADVLEAHAASLAAHGGLDGVRDPGLLESAVMSPRSGYYASLVDLAAALLFGIARNHAFLDGNKRTAVVTAFAFLRVNGATIVAPTRETHAIVDGVAAGQITREQLGAYLTLLLGGDPRVFDELAPPDAAASDVQSEGAAHRIDRRSEPRRPRTSSSGGRANITRWRWNGSRFVRGLGSPRP